MSYDVELLDKNGKVLVVPNHSEGGTYVVGGTPYAELNITYNYSWFYYQHLDKKHGLRWLHEKKAWRTEKRLEKTIKQLGKTRWKDYWAPTPGNAGHALSVLLSWVKTHSNTS